MFDNKKQDKQVGLKMMGKKDFAQATAAVQAVLATEKQIEGLGLIMNSAIGALPANIQSNAKASEEVAAAASKDYKKALSTKNELIESLPELYLDAKLALSVLSPSTRAKVDVAGRFV
jgi:hypothetical protein